MICAIWGAVAIVEVNAEDSVCVGAVCRAAHVKEMRRTLQCNKVVGVAFGVVMKVGSIMFPPKLVLTTPSAVASWSTVA